MVIDAESATNSVLTLDSGFNGGLGPTVRRLRIDLGDELRLSVNSRLKSDNTGFAGAGEWLINGLLTVPTSTEGALDGPKTINGTGKIVLGSATGRPEVYGIFANNGTIDGTSVRLAENGTGLLEIHGGTLRFNNGAIFENSGVFDVRGSPTITGDGSGRLRILPVGNITFYESATFPLDLDLEGQLTVSNGRTATFNAGGLFDQTGKVILNGPSAEATFTGATPWRSRGQAVEFAGTGYVNFKDTVLQFEDIDPGTVTDNPDIDAGARVAFQGNNTVSGNGTLSTTGFVFQSGSNTILDGATLKTTGTADVSVWNGSGGSLELRNGARFLNDGRFVIQSQVGAPPTVPGIRGQAGTVFHNMANGRLIHDVSTQTDFDVDFHNDGVLEFRSGTFNFLKQFTGTGGLAASGGAKVNLSLTAANLNQLPSLLQTIGANSEISIQLPNLPNFSIAVDLNGGRIVAAGAGNIVAAAGGNIVAAGGGNIVAAGEGNLSGSGIFSGAGLIQNGGSLRPGMSPGVLTWTGNLTVEAGGVLDLEIAGLAAGTQYDRVDVSGMLTMSGTLAIQFLNGFGSTVQATDVFDIVTAGSPIVTDLAGTRVNVAGTYGSFEVQLVNGGQTLRLVNYQLGPVSYGRWVERHRLIGANAGWDADPNGNGLSNLLEYALGVDPNAPGVSGITSAVIEVDGQRYFSLSYTRPAGTDAPGDIFYSPERAAAIASENWSASPSDVISLGVTGTTGVLEVVTVRSAHPINPGSSREFLRLRVTLTNPLISGRLPWDQSRAMNRGRE